MHPDQFAEIVRQACLQAALTAYEDAGVQGLCEAGRWEAAVGAIESLNLAALAASQPDQADNPAPVPDKP